MRIGMKIALALALALMAVSVLSPTVAAAPGDIDKADTTWVMVSIGLVFIMTPAVALFYGGMLRKESVLSMLGQSIVVISVITLIWVVIGYSLAFGDDIGGIIGGLDFVMLEGVGLDPSPVYATTIPHIGFMMFQGTFAIITAALILGGVAERMRFKALILFIMAWAILVYSPVAHWVWGGGWIGELGALDFAGGTVVHIASGTSALAAALVLGKRSKIIRKDTPHNIPMVVIGGSILWIGWFGFNGGSALAADGIAVSALVVTHISAAAAAATWGLINWFHVGRPGVLGLITGGVAGLVAITPAAGFVEPSGALAIGIGAGVLCYFGVNLKRRLKVDDALDVFGVHGVGGIWGALATGIFASTAVNPAGDDGLLYGGYDLMSAQLISVVVVAAFAFTASVVIMKVMSLFMEVRMTKEEEMIGADIIHHGENAYT